MKQNMDFARANTIIKTGWRTSGSVLCACLLLTLLCWTGGQSVKADSSIGDVPAGANPVAVAVNPVTNKIYVANAGSQTVTVIDGSNNSTTAVLAGDGPNVVAINPVTNLTVDLTAADVTGKGILAYQFDLLYDPNLIEAQAEACEVSETISSGMTAICAASELGVLKVAVFGTTPLTGEGALLKLKFKAVRKAAKASTLSLQNFMFNEGVPTAVTVKDNCNCLSYASLCDGGNLSEADWYLQSSRDGLMAIQFGAAEDRSIPNAIVPR